MQDFLYKILQETCTPLFKMMQLWMVHGDAHDLRGEFFVATGEGERVWEKYWVDVEKVPTFVGCEVAYRVLLAGKTVNFIRRCCDEIEWSIPNSLKDPKIKNWQEVMINPGALNEWIFKVSETTNKKLILLLFGKYRFLDHCKGINRYLLSAQGDLHQHLMDLVYEILCKPAEKIYKYFALHT